jgi:hypothetical protein
MVRGNELLTGETELCLADLDGVSGGRFQIEVKLGPFVLTYDSNPPKSGANSGSSGNGSSGKW